MRLTRHIALAALATATLTACSGSGFAQPSPRAFAPGSCRALAPAVLQLGRTLHGLGTSAPSDAERASLKRAQSDVRARQTDVPGSLAPTVDELVTKVGLLRLRTDTDSYTPALARDAMAAYRDLVKACTTT